MIERFAQFNLFDYVSVNNERTGVIVDFDYVVPLSSEDSEQELSSISVASTSKQDKHCGREISDEEMQGGILDEGELVDDDAALIKLHDEFRQKKQQKLSLKEKGQSTKAGGRSANQAKASSAKNTAIDEIEKEAAKQSGHNSVHMSSLYQFVSKEMLDQVSKDHDSDQVYYWVLCEQDDNAVMAYVPEELVASVDEEPSRQLLDNLDAWCAQTNIQYCH